MLDSIKTTIVDLILKLHEVDEVDFSLKGSQDLSDLFDESISNESLLQVRTLRGKRDGQWLIVPVLDFAGEIEKRSGSNWSRIVRSG